MEIPGYKIQEEIGKGGMATVYLAVQESLKRAVVLKVLDNVQRISSSYMTQRFMDEGRILASLHHPNIVTIYDIGLTGENLYISMEYVENGDLKERMRSRIKPEQALNIVFKIGAALSSAHKHKVIHRDVKPANILFRDQDTPLLTDFGIAKQADDDKELTSTGIFLGSPYYVSPEQADDKILDGRSDIYSLGCVFYEMLTGCKPYQAESIIDIIIQHKESPVPRLPEELASYQPLLERMIAKSPDARFTDAEEMLRSVKKLQAATDKSTPAPGFEISGTGHGPDSGKRRKQKTTAMLIILLAVSAVFFFGLQFVEIKIKHPAVSLDKVPTSTVLARAAPTDTNLADQTLASINAAPKPEGNAQTGNINNAPKPADREVVQALAWLGKQSLDEYKLTYPAKDNAYYYYSRLLQLQPDNHEAYAGILSIADRYALLAERSLANNELEKTKAYIDIGLRINPNNATLLSIKSLLNNQQSGLWNTLKSLF